MTGQHIDERDNLPPEAVLLSDEVREIGRSDARVLISGGSDVAEFLAQSIHQGSRRATGPFVAVSCVQEDDAAVATRLFGDSIDQHGALARANHGTVLLNDIDALSAPMQSRLLLFLATGEVASAGSDDGIARVNVRVVSSTEQNLRDRLLRGQFLEDLFYRLNVVHLVLPGSAADH